MVLYHRLSPFELYGIMENDLTEALYCSQMAPNCLYSALILTKVVHYKGNSVPFGKQPLIYAIILTYSKIGYCMKNAPLKLLELCFPLLPAAFHWITSHTLTPWILHYFLQWILFNDTSRLSNVINVKNG